MDKSHKSRKKLAFALILLLIISLSFLIIPRENKSYAADRSGYIVIDAKKRTVYKEYNEHLRLPMASTTKVMTALIVIENCKLDEKVKIPKQAVGIEGSSIYLKEGEELSVGELLYGLMLRSGNDAACALAIHVAGSVENFAEIMNIRAQAMKLTDSHFTNPSGLHDDNHYTTAYDLAVIACEAMKYAEFRKIVSTNFISVGKGENTRYFKNKNKMLHLYEGGNGIKTGFTKKAGRCLVSSATRDGVTMVSVVLNRPDMWNESVALLDYAFDNYSVTVK